MKKILLFALFCATGSGLYRFCHKQTDGFSMSRIQSRFQPEKRWESPVSLEEEARVKEILSQPFSYLGKGAQCYAFVSEDGKYVVKFFRITHIEAPSWIKNLPFLEKWRSEKIFRREQKKEKDFTSYKIAFETLKEETALLYLHLNKTAHLKKKIQIIDKLGISHTLDLDEMEFMVQRRAQPFYRAIEEMIDGEEILKVKTVIKELVLLLHKRRAYGIADKDPDLATNFGVIGERPVEFDVGRFKRAEKNEPPSQEVLRITDHFRRFLNTKNAELADFLTEEIHSQHED